MQVRSPTQQVKNSPPLCRSVSAEATLARVRCIWLWKTGQRKTAASKWKAKFISNVDPDDAAAVLNSIDVAHSIFVLVSKSGTTLETLTNEPRKRRSENAGLDASKHMIAVTSETSPLAKSEDYLAAFFMDDYIGGRYSSTSAVGGAVLSLAFGPEVFAAFLEGAAAEDKLSANKDVLQNPGDARCADRCLREKRSWLSEHCSSSVLPGTEPFPGSLTAGRYGVQR